MKAPSPRRRVAWWPDREDLAWLAVAGFVAFLYLGIGLS